MKPFNARLTSVTFSLFFLLCAVNAGAQEVKKIVREGYTLSYASSMTIDSTDEDFDLDSYFTLNTTSDNGTINFFIFNIGVDENEAVAAQLKAFQENVMKGGTVTRFTSWGNYKGQGAVITGKLMGLFKGEVRIFAHTEKEKAFLMVYQVFDEDKAKDLPGLQLIEKTFKMK